MNDATTQFTRNNRYLDRQLQMCRGPLGVRLELKEFMCTGMDGYIHFSIPLTVGEEAAWWALGEEHAVPSAVSAQLLSPANIACGELYAKGEIIRNGKSVLTAQAKVYQSTKLLTLVTVQFVRFVKLGTNFRA